MSKKVLATMLAATMLMGATASTVSAAGFTAPEGVDPSEYHLAICIHSMDNEYWAQEAKGAQLAAEYYGVGADILTCDSDDNKQIQGIKDYIAQYGDKAIFVVDPKKEKICVQEAHTLGIPLIGIADTNCDPEELDYVIPGNDDAIRAVKLIASKMADAVIEAKQGEAEEVDEVAEAGEEMLAADTTDAAADIETVVADAE